MRKYTIGQVLYVLIPNELLIHPVRVVEEVSRKTLEGEEVKYTIEVVNKGKKSRAQLNDDVEVFEDITLAENHLIANAIRAVNEICESARLAAEKEFGVERIAQLPQSPTKPLPAVVEDVKNVKRKRSEGVRNQQTVILDNGEVVKVTLPSED